MLGSIAVILGAIIIKLTAWKIVDPILAVLIGLWVLPRTGTLLREAGNVLMMGVPGSIKFEDVRSALLAHLGVIDVHDLHVWALGSREPALTRAHRGGRRFGWRRYLCRDQHPARREIQDRAHSSGGNG
jgi:cobalt-zinc-cadmium efflux system protein